MYKCGCYDAYLFYKDMIILMYMKRAFYYILVPTFRIDSTIAYPQKILSGKISQCIGLYTFVQCTVLYAKDNCLYLKSMKSIH